MITLEDFNKIEMKVGTIIDASINKGTKNPAYKLKIDLGKQGIKSSSAQITDLYKPEDLIGRKVITVTNLNPIRICEVKSEVLVLGADTKDGVVLLSIDDSVPNGSKIY